MFLAIIALCRTVQLYSVGFN